jgi:hypothetical protein
VQRSQSVLTHQTRYSVLAAGLARLTKIEKDAGRSVNAVAGVERRADQAKEPSVLLPSVGHRFPKPFVVAAGSDFENAAQRIDAVFRLVRLDEFVDLSDSTGNLAGGHRGHLSRKT